MQTGALLAALSLSAAVASAQGIDPSSVTSMAFGTWDAGATGTGQGHFEAMVTVTDRTTIAEFANLLNFAPTNQTRLIPMCGYFAQIVIGTTDGKKQVVDLCLDGCDIVITTVDDMKDLWVVKNSSNTFRRAISLLRERNPAAFARRVEELRTVLEVESKHGGSVLRELEGRGIKGEEEIGHGASP